MSADLQLLVAGLLAAAFVLGGIGAFALGAAWVLRGGLCRHGCCDCAHPPVDPEIFMTSCDRGGHR